VGFYRKKPVVIEAERLPTAEDQDNDIIAYVDRCVALAEWCGGRSYMMHTNEEPSFTGDSGKDRIEIETLEGTMSANPGDWIIKGVNGEFYPCKPDIFAKTYEPVAELAEI
jgi:hypothetical protein